MDGAFGGNFHNPLPFAAYRQSIADVHVRTQLNCLQKGLTHHVPASYVAIYPQFLNPGTAPDSVVLCYLTRACQLSLSHSISAAIVVAMCGAADL